MRFNEIFTEAPDVQSPPPAASAPTMVDKTLSGAAKVAGGIDKAAGAVRSIQDKMQNFGSKKDPFASVNKNALRSALDNVVAGKQLTPKELDTIKRFANSF